jgi:hypothetical protein
LIGIYRYGSGGGPETLGSNVLGEQLNSNPKKAKVPRYADSMPTKKPVGHELRHCVPKNNNYSIVEIINEVFVPFASSLDEEIELLRTDLLQKFFLDKKY